MKSQELEIAFGEPGWQLRLEIKGRAYPDSDSDWDRDQLDTLIVGEAGDFRAVVATLVGSHELVYLRRLLAQLYEQVGREPRIEFRLREAVLEIEAQVNKLGHVTMNVEIDDDPMTRARLLFTIEADQTYLPGWIGEIEKALRRFPTTLRLRQGR